MVASEQALVTGKQLDTLCINTIRTLAIDAVQQANSGHPGAPMGLAPVTYSSGRNFFVTTRRPPGRTVTASCSPPAMPPCCSTPCCTWLACGGDKVKSQRNLLSPWRRSNAFASSEAAHRAIRSRTSLRAWKPPRGRSARARATAWAWPLRANGWPRILTVLALSSSISTCTPSADGDFMEGVAGEAASLAGHLKLSNLCWIYDNNRITLDGPADWSFSEDVASRFLGYGWNITHVADANDLDNLGRAFDTFDNTKDRPTLIIVDSQSDTGPPTNRIATCSRRAAGRRRSQANEKVLRLA